MIWNKMKWWQDLMMRTKAIVFLYSTLFLFFSSFFFFYFVVLRTELREALELAMVLYQKSLAPTSFAFSLFFK
jgi:hypothetical protein